MKKRVKSIMILGHHSAADAVVENQEEQDQPLTDLMVVFPFGDTADSGYPSVPTDALPLAFLSQWPFVDEFLHISVDNLRAGWYSQSLRRIRAAFHLIVCHPAGEITELYIGSSGANSSITYTPGDSPKLGESNPSIPWSAKSRFQIDCTVESIPILDGDRFAVFGRFSNGRSIQIGEFLVGI